MHKYITLEGTIKSRQFLCRAWLELAPTRLIVATRVRTGTLPKRKKSIPKLRWSVLFVRYFSVPVCKDCRW